MENQDSVIKVAMLPDYRVDNPYQQLLADHLEKVGVRVDFPRGYRRLAHFSRTLRAEGMEDVDILHLHWPDPYLKGGTNLTRWLYARKVRFDLSYALKSVKGLAWTVHNLGRHDAGSDSEEGKFYRWLARRADVLFVHDPSLVAKVREKWAVPVEKIFVSPHGHFCDHYGALAPRADARNRLGIKPGDKVALFLGMLRPYKGLEELLHVWPEVVEQCPEAKLMIVGGGNDAAYTGKIRKQVAGYRDVFLHDRYIPDQEIPDFYGAADLAVFPFRAITTSGSLILALSYGKPVVAPSVPSIIAPLDFQKELLYEPGSYDGLRNALIRGLNTDPTAYGDGFASIREQFSWEKAAENTRKGYRICLKE